MGEKKRTDKLEWKIKSFDKLQEEDFTSLWEDSVLFFNINTEFITIHDGMMEVIVNKHFIIEKERNFITIRGIYGKSKV